MPIQASQSYDTFASQLASALDWLRHLGIEYERTRVGEYGRAIELLLNIYASNDRAQADEARPRIVNAVYEAQDLITIFQGLSALYGDKIRDRLKRYVSGPHSYTQEVTQTSSNAARNFGFELLVMARLAQRGIPLDFTVPSDVAVRFDNRSVLFECKRPQSGNGVEGSIKRAFKQLEARYRSPTRARHRGIIAIDISKVVNPTFGKLELPNAEVLDEQTVKIVDAFIARYGQYWQLERNRRTIAVLIRFSLMGADLSMGSRMTFCLQFAIHGIDNAGKRNLLLAQSLASALNQDPFKVV